MAYIYCFYFESDPDLYYIGKTINTPNIRYNSHIRAMIANKHHSYKVQNIYNKNKILPIFSILEETSALLVNKLEIYYIKEFDSFNYGLNCSEIQGTNNSTSIYSKIQILKVFALLSKGEYSYEYISNRTKVTVGTIKAIRRGVNHSWLQEQYPYKWEVLKTRSHLNNSTTTLLQQNKLLPSFISPSGVVHSNITNLKEFVYSLPFDNRASAYKMFSAMNTRSNKAKSYKGWKLHSLT